jgi:hypothetical protein
MSQSRQSRSRADTSVNSSKLKWSKGRGSLLAAMANRHHHGRSVAAA